MRVIINVTDRRGSRWGCLRGVVVVVVTIRRSRRRSSVGTTR